MLLGDKYKHINDMQTKKKIQKLLTHIESGFGTCVWHTDLLILTPLFYILLWQQVVFEATLENTLKGNEPRTFIKATVCSRRRLLTALASWLPSCVALWSTGRQILTSWFTALSAEELEKDQCEMNPSTAYPQEHSKINPPLVSLCLELENTNRKWNLCW